MLSSSVLSQTPHYIQQNILPFSSQFCLLGDLFFRYNFLYNLETLHNFWGIGHLWNFTGKKHLSCPSGSQEFFLPLLCRKMRSAERIHAEFIISWEKEFIISQLSSIWCVSWWLDAHRYISCEHDARQALRRRPTASFLPIHSWARSSWCLYFFTLEWTLFSRLLCFDCRNTLKASTTPHCLFPSDSLLYFFTLLCSAKKACLRPLILH